MIHYSDLYLEEIESYVPSVVVTNEELIQREALKMKSSWIEKNIGIVERRWASPDEAASDLATRALEKMNLTTFEGSLFVSTISPDYLTPSTSSLIKRKAHLKNHLPAYDLSAACAGWIFAIEAAATRLKACEEREALAVATEVRSRYLNPKDRRTVFLFGDAAIAAKLVTEKPKKPHFQLNWTHTSSIATEEFEILVPAGGSVRPLNQSVLDQNEQFIHMVDGNSIVEATQRELIDSIKEALREGSLADYDLVLFHQGNKRLILTILGLFGLDESKTHITFDRFGNSSSASVGVTLRDAMDAKRLKQGSKVLLITFGAGQHLGLAELVRYE